MGRTRRILNEYGFRGRKSRGQNFLVHEATLQRIADAARLGPLDTVIEIGPGPGNLTRRLCRAAGRVVAIEVEHELCLILKSEVKAANVAVIEASALDVDFRGLAAAGQRLKVVANLPYNITTPVLFKLLSTPELFSELLLLVQLEVAKRITAAPGTRAWGILGAQCRLLADCAVVFGVGPEAFRPRPRVESALTRLRMLPAPRARVIRPELYRRVVRAAFAGRRKTLRNSFTVGEFGFGPELIAAALREAGIDPGRRAETVTVEEFAAIANAVAGRAEEENHQGT